MELLRRRKIHAFMALSDTQANYSNRLLNTNLLSQNLEYFFLNISDFFLLMRPYRLVAFGEVY